MNRSPRCQASLGISCEAFSRRSRDQDLGKKTNGMTLTLTPTQCFVRQPSMHVSYRQNQHQNEYQIIPRVSNSPSAILFVHISFIHLIIDNRASSTFGLVSGRFRLHVPVLPACMRARGAGSQITLQGQGLSSPNSAHQHCGILHVGNQLACGPCQSEHQRHPLKQIDGK